MNAIATIIAAVVSTPFDVVKTRVMTEVLYEAKPIRAHFKEIIKEDGFGVLFRGCGLRAFYMCSIISTFIMLDSFLSNPIDEARKISQKIRYDD